MNTGRIRTHMRSMCRHRDPEIMDASERFSATALVEATVFDLGLDPDILEDEGNEIWDIAVEVIEEFDVD